MKNKVISSLVITFVVFFISFVIRITHDLSISNDKILDSKNVLEAGKLISTRLLVTSEELSLSSEWVNLNYKDEGWEEIEIPKYQIVQQKNFKEGNFAYYRIKLPKKSFSNINHLQNETFLVLQSIYFSRFDIAINGELYRTFKPVNAGENRIAVPVDENRDNLIAIKGFIKPGDTGIDSRNKIMLGKGVEFNAIHSANYKAQIVYQLVFILCKGSILFIFALIFLLLRVDRSFDKFFIFGLCAILEELIAGDYLYGPLNFNQMVYLYNLVNLGGAISVFLFFGQLTNTEYKKSNLVKFGLVISAISFALTIDALNWNYLVDLTKYMKIWNLLTVAVLCFYFPKILKIDKVLSSGLLIAILLYIWGALFSDNIGLNFKAYGNLLLFIMVAYQTFGLFRRDQDQLQLKEKQLLEQEKDVAIGKTASLLAHDVRKPLEQLRLVIEKLGSGEVNQEFLEIAKNDIELSIATVDQQVNDIVNYSKSSQAILSETSIYRVLSHALKQVMSIHQEMKVDIQYDFQAQFKIKGEQARLSGALVNLISNAVEAIRDIGDRFTGKIKLSTVIVGEKFQIKIFNDGPEIPENLLTEIFKPLFTHGKPGGTGLGLASVVKSVHELEGEIEVHNIKGSGVEFILTFLRGHEVDDWKQYQFKADSNAFNYNLNSKPEETTDSSFKVLVLENDKVKLNSINHTLNNLDHKIHIVTAESQSITEEFIKKNRYDFYLLNRSLGGESIKLNSLPYLKEEVALYVECDPENIQVLALKAFSLRKRILFVDDTKLFRIAWLMFHGEQNIKCVASPEEALALINEAPKHYDICIVDYHFSNSSLDGVALAEKIRIISPDLPILISSSLEQQFEGYQTIQKKDFDVRRFL